MFDHSCHFLSKVHVLWFLNLCTWFW